MTRFLPLLLPLTLSLLTSCSMDIIPVHQERVNSAKMAEQPLLRGPNAPGAFKQAWKFDDGKGYLFDPSELAVSNGAVRFAQPLSTDGRGVERQAILVTNHGPQFRALDSLTEVTGPGHRGIVAYQLSKDNSSWYYHKGSAWVPAGPTYRQANTASELAPFIGKFHSEVGEGTLFLKVFLVAPTGAEPVELKEIDVQGISPRMD